MVYTVCLSLPSFVLMHCLLLLSYLHSVYYGSCVFTKIVSDSEKTIFSLHVDDLGQFHAHDHFQTELVKMTTDTFSAPTVQEGENGIYLGLEYSFDRKKNSVELDMSKYVEKMLAEFDIKSGSKTCCAGNFMDFDSEGEKVYSKKFASAVMSLYYYASRIRLETICSLLQ